MTGPAEAAAVVVDGTRQRVLYCGGWLNSFIFGVRMQDPGLNTTVLSGDKLSAPRDPGEFEKFAHDHGVNRVVLLLDKNAKGWNQLHDRPAPSMAFEREIPLVTDVDRWKGRAVVYRFTNPAASPKNPSIRLDRLRTVLQAE